MSDRGPQGEQGERGEPGATGAPLSRRWRWSVVYLVLAALALAALAFYGGVHEQGASQAAQRRAGLTLERQLCATFGKAAALKPPAGDPRMNPSRAYLQGQHVIWTEVVTDLHCNRLPR